MYGPNSQKQNLVLTMCDTQNDPEWGNGVVDDDLLDFFMHMLSTRMSPTLKYLGTSIDRDSDPEDMHSTYTKKRSIVLCTYVLNIIYLHTEEEESSVRS